MALTRSLQFAFPAAAEPECSQEVGSLTQFSLACFLFTTSNACEPQKVTPVSVFCNSVSNLQRMVKISEGYPQPL